MTTANSFPLPSHPSPKLGEPAWDLALMYPLQRHWSTGDYPALDTGMLVKYSEGVRAVFEKCGDGNEK